MNPDETQQSFNPILPNSSFKTPQNDYFDEHEEGELLKMVGPLNNGTNITPIICLE